MSGVIIIKNKIDGGIEWEDILKSVSNAEQKILRMS